MEEGLNEVVENIIQEKVVRSHIFHTKEYFQHQLTMEKKRAERHRESFSVVVLNLKELKNEFKLILATNSTKFVNELADIIFSLVRSIDIAAWYDCDKITILLCDTPFSGAQQLVKRLNNQLLSNIALKHSDKLFLLDKIKTNIFTYPEKNYNNPKLTKEFNIDLHAPANLNEQILGDYKNQNPTNIKRFIDALLSYFGVIPSMTITNSLIKLR